MQVFKTYFLVMKKNFSSIILYTGIFIALALLFDQSGSDTQEQFRISKSDIGILDYDASPISNALVDYLSAKHNIVDVPEEEKDIQDVLYNLEAVYVLVIPKGFGDAFGSDAAAEMLRYYASKDSAEDVFLNIQVNQFLSLITTYYGNGYPIDEAIALGKETTKTETEVSIHSSSGSNSGIYYFFNYIPYVLLCMMITTMGPVLMRFYNKEIEARSLCSSMPPSRYTLWLSAGTGVFSLFCFALFIILAAILYPGTLFSSLGMLYVANTFVFLLVCVAITLIISMVAGSANALTILSNVLGLGMSFFCGIFVPMEFLPQALLKFSQFLPAYWYVKALHVLETYTGTASQTKQYFTYLGVQFCFVAALFSVALLLRKKPMRKSA